MKEERLRLSSVTMDGDYSGPVGLCQFFFLLSFCYLSLLHYQSDIENIASAITPRTMYSVTQVSQGPVPRVTLEFPLDRQGPNAGPGICLPFLRGKGEEMPARTALAGEGIFVFPPSFQKRRKDPNIGTKTFDVHTFACYVSW